MNVGHSELKFTILWDSYLVVATEGDWDGGRCWPADGGPGSGRGERSLPEHQIRLQVAPASLGTFGAPAFADKIHDIGGGEQQNPPVAIVVMGPPCGKCPAARAVCGQAPASGPFRRRGATAPDSAEMHTDL